MIANNIAYNALLAGHTVLFRNASNLIADLSCDSPALRKVNSISTVVSLYRRGGLLILRFQCLPASSTKVVNRRYERGSPLVTTNRAFRECNAVFPHATSIATMLDRLLHHADVFMIEGDSYRLRESETESAKRRKE